MKLKNRFNGREFESIGLFTSLDRSLWRLRKRIRDFDRYVEFNRMSVSFLTITQSDKSVADGYRWISGIMKLLVQLGKRANVDVKYVAVLEIQPKRYLERGVLAAHWHVAIACSLLGALPHAKRGSDGRIKKVRNGSVVTWDWLRKNIKQKIGMYFVCDAYSNRIYDYLGKYISKGSELDEFKLKVGKRVRIFSGSRIPVSYQMSDGQAAEHAELLSLHPEFSDLYWRREDSRIVARVKSVQDRFIGSSRLSPKVTYPRVHSISGDWIVTDGELSFEAKGGDSSGSRS